MPGRVRLLGLVVSAAAAIQAALFAAVLWRTMILRPFWDMFSWLGDALRMDGGPLAYLWKPHNEHHMLLVRLLAAVDVQTGVRGVPFVVAGTVAVLASAWMVLGQLRRTAGPVLVPVAWLGPMLLLTAPASVDCSIPINTVYPLALVWIVAALVLFDGEAGRTPATPARRCAALAAAALAGLANAVGMVAWPALLWSARQGGASRRWLAGIGAAGVAYAALYLAGLPQGGAGTAGPLPAPLRLLKMLDYLLATLGLPLSRAPGLGAASRALGAVLLIVGAVTLLRDTFTARPKTRLHRFGTGLVMVALATALLAAIGRVDLEPEVKVPVRYAVLIAPLHVGLLALALEWGASRPRRQGGFLAAAAGLAAALLVLQVFGGRSAVLAADVIAATLDRYDAGVREPGMERVVFPDLAEADRITAALRQHDGDR